MKMLVFSTIFSFSTFGLNAIIFVFVTETLRLYYFPIYAKMSAHVVNQFQFCSFSSVTDFEKFKLSLFPFANDINNVNVKENGSL